MNAHDILLAAAAQIERTPNSFRYRSTSIPTCGSPGCAMGWIGSIAGFTERPEGGLDMISRRVLGVTYWPEWDRSMPYFEARMSELNDRWKGSARECAKALRLYAAKYHAPAKPVARPTSALVADLMAKVNGARIPETAELTALT